MALAGPDGSAVQMVDLNIAELTPALLATVLANLVDRTLVWRAFFVSGLKTESRADTLAAEVLRRANPAIGVNENARMAEEPRGENRDRDEGLRLLKQRQHVGRQRHFGGVELVVPKHAKEGFFDRQGKISEIDAVDADPAFHQSTGAVVIPTGKRQPQFALRQHSRRRGGQGRSGPRGG